MVSGLSDLLTRRARVEEFLELPVITFEREALFRAGRRPQARARRRGGGRAHRALVAVPRGVGAPVRDARQRPSSARWSAPASGGGTYGMFVPADREAPSAAAAVRLEARAAIVPGAPERAPRRDEPRRAVAGRGRQHRQLRREGAAQVRRPSRNRRALRSSRSSTASSPNGAPAALDAYYVQNWSLGGDLRVLLAWLARCVAGRLERTAGPAGRASRPDGAAITRGVRTMRATFWIVVLLMPRARQGVGSTAWNTLSYPYDDRIFDLAIDGSTIWMSTQGDGLVGYDGMAWVKHVAADGGLRLDEWNYTVFADAAGDKWVTRDGDRDGGPAGRRRHVLGQDRRRLDLLLAPRRVRPLPRLLHGRGRGRQQVVRHA